MTLETQIVVLILITLFAATVNGALGHGFSSLTVPVALLYYTNRTLNPVVVLVEVVVNGYMLVINRKSIPAVWKKMLPLLWGVLPGVLLGSVLLFAIRPGWIKLTTYLILLPLIFLQAAGVRRPLELKNGLGFLFGSGIGVLYSVTTISGPPLAVMLNNQGFVKQEFRAALGIIRVAESSLTALAYLFLGLYTRETGTLLGWIVPGILIGIPFGTFIIRKIHPDTFRRVCMSFDLWVIGFGLSRVMIDLQLAAHQLAYSIWISVILLDSAMLYSFFTRRKTVILDQNEPQPTVRGNPWNET